MKNVYQILLIFSIVIIFSACNSQGQESVSENKQAEIIIQQNADTLRKKEVSLLFLGDIMQHQLQIESAYNPATLKYDFSSQFKYVKPVFEKSDIVIGNLEVTFGGPPYTGYPKFSSPSSLGEAIKKSGINYLVMSNNHVYDRDKAGFENTLRVVDSLGFKRTGTFIDYADKMKNNPMVIEKNDFRIALFNYGYGVNDDFF